MTSPDQWRGGVEGARGDGRGAWPAPPPSQLHQPQAPCQVGVSHAASTSTQLTLPSLHPPPPGLHLHTSTLHPPAAPHGHIWPQQATTAALKCRCRCCVHVLFHHILIVLFQSNQKCSASRLDYIIYWTLHITPPPTSWSQLPRLSFFPLLMTSVSLELIQ